MVGYEGSTRNLNHCTHLVGYSFATLGKDLLSGSVDDVGLHLNLGLNTDEGHHDLGMNLDTLGLHVESSLNNGASLHLGDFGIGVAQTAATMTEHGVEFFETVANEFHFLERTASLVGEFTHGFQLVRNKLVQRGVEQADGHFITVHGFEDTLEVATLQRKQLAESHTA